MGLATGDAMGGPLEFMSTNQVQIKHGRVTSMIGGGWLQLRSGQYTGNTLLMMAMAENLIEHRDLDIGDLSARYLKWHRTNPRDIGPVTRAALALIHEGENIETAAARADTEMSGESDDNDPLPRCVPLTLLYYHSPEILMQKTVQAVTLTHRNKKVISAAVTLNLILSRILNGESERDKIFAQVANLLDENELGIYNMLPDVSGKKEESLRSSSRVQDTLETAVWAVWKKKNYRDAIVTVINLGGAAGTIGAVTGALAGACYGEGNIPPAWLQALEDKNIIAGFAGRIAKLAEPGKP